MPAFSRAIILLLSLLISIFAISDLVESNRTFLDPKAAMVSPWLETGSYLTYNQLLEWNGENATKLMTWNITNIQGDLIDLHLISHGINVTDGNVTVTTGAANLTISASTREVIRCSDPYYIGEKWPFWIETNVTSGSVIDIWYGLNIISGDERISILGKLRDCWVVEYTWATATMKRWYDKISGIVLKIHVIMHHQNITTKTTETAAHTNIAQYFRVHNLDSGMNYATIQEAINALETISGHIIFVEEGIYNEHLVVNKAISLIGQNEQTTIIDGNMTQDVVRVTQDGVNITGFTIQRSGRISFNAGISLSKTHCNISGNRIIANEIGIYGAPRNTSITNNTITNNHVGVAIDPGATFNVISRNRLMANNVSIHLYCANTNNIFENNITNNWRSITLGYSRNNNFHHNYFFNNTEHILIFPSGYTNSWDNGYPSGGNYWNNYEDRYPNATELDGSGIWDTPYIIDENNQDNYPLIPEFSSLIFPFLMLATSLAILTYKKKCRV